MRACRTGPYPVLGDEADQRDQGIDPELQVTQIRLQLSGRPASGDQRHHPLPQLSQLARYAVRHRSVNGLLGEYLPTGHRPEGPFTEAPAGGRKRTQYRSRQPLRDAAVSLGETASVAMLSSICRAATG